jgi:hypothetical protein
LTTNEHYKGLKYWLKSLFLFVRAVAAQQVGQVLREGSARHHGVASRFHGLGLQVALQVREEADDGRALLQLRLELGDQRQRLDVGIVEVEHDQARTVRLLLAAGQLCDRFLLLVLDERDLDAQLARGLGDLGVEEEVFDEEVDIFVGASSAIGIGRPTE